MNNSGVGYTGIIVQGFAIFVAISILLGRIYFQSYLGTLGIPLTEVRLNAIDYSVISPDVTILGVGVAILSVFFWWYVTTWSLPSAERSWVKIAIGIGLIIVGYLTGIGLNFVMERAESLEAFRLGVFGLASLFPITVSATGGATFAFGFLVSGGKDTEVSGGKNDGAIFDLTDILVPIVPIGIGIALVFMSIVDSVMIGRLDARNTLLNAPQAKIEFVSDRTDYFRSNYGNCHGDSISCEYQVIFIGDNFVYLSPVDSKQHQEERLLYAVPVRDIAGITYVSKEIP